ncbi:MAG: nicotinate (nicotinamide) nucleotide adenylyltransferase [Phycisphaerales bacterium]|nr:nicotinate (nicotinamide) nucleotide adenylyltransferase [Phycisphaerales bacterium]
MIGSGDIMLFGGTFDPPHRAHIELPRLVASAIGCARIIYIPAARNPLKDEGPTASVHRLAMLRIALAGRTDVEVSPIEIRRFGPSYMIDTLMLLRPCWPGAVRRLLIGSDQALEFRRWHRWEAILDLATPAVMVRPPLDRDSFATALRERGFDASAIARWCAWTVDVPHMDIASTALRADPVAHAADLPPGVLDYIRAHRLYGTTPPA